MDYERNGVRRSGSVNGISTRYNPHDEGRGSEKEWESSFSQILSRTKQNINRVNEKYGTGGSLPARVSYHDYGHGLQAEANHPPENLRGSADPRSTYPQLRHHEDYPRNTPPSADSNRERERGTPTYDSSIETRRFSAHDEDKRIISELTYRISRLEQKLHDKDNSESSERKENNERREVVERKVRKVDQTDLERKVNYLVSDVSELSEQVSGTVINVRDVQRQSAQSMAQIGTVALIVEEVQKDVDSRRGLLVKMDSWARLGEVWRAEVDEKMASVGKMVKAVERASTEQSEGMLEMVSRNDFNIFKERFIASAAWKEKIERDFSLLEKQLYLMQTSNKNITLAKIVGESELVSVNLTSPSHSLPAHYPSRQQEEILDQLEDRFQERLKGSVRQIVTEAFRDLERNLKADLRNSVQDLQPTHTVSSEGEYHSPDRDRSPEGSRGRDGTAPSSSSSPRKVEDSESLRALSSELQQLASAVSDLKSAREREKATALSTPDLQKKIDEYINMSTATVRTAQDRCAVLESLVREGEASNSKGLTAVRDELTSRVSNHEEEVTDSLISHERRMLAIEKISSDVLSRLNLNVNAMESFFETSEDAIKLKQNLQVTEGILQTLKGLESRSKDLASKTLDLSTEFEELKEVSTGLQGEMSKVQKLSLANVKHFAKVEESVSDLRIETEHTVSLVNKETRSIKSENEKLKAAEVKIEKELSLVQTLLSDMNASAGAMKSQAIDSSRAVASMRTDRGLGLGGGVSSTDTDTYKYSEKLVDIESGMHEAKVLISKVESDYSTHKKEQHERVTSLEEEVAKMKSRQEPSISPGHVPTPLAPAMVFTGSDDIKFNLVNAENVKMQFKLNSLEGNISTILDGYKTLRQQVDEYAPVEAKVLNLCGSTNDMQIDIDRLKGLSSAPHSAAYLSSRMDTVENQLSVIARVPGLSNSSPGYEDRIARIERELLRLQSDIRFNENKKGGYLEADEETQGRRSKQNTNNNNNNNNNNNGGHNGRSRNSNSSSRQAYSHQNKEYSNRSSIENPYPNTPPNANHDKYSNNSNSNDNDNNNNRYASNRSSGNFSDINATEEYVNPMNQLNNDTRNSSSSANQSKSHSPSSNQHASNQSNSAMQHNNRSAVNAFTDCNTHNNLYQNNCGHHDVTKNSESANNIYTRSDSMNSRNGQTAGAAFTSDLKGQGRDGNADWGDSRRTDGMYATAPVSHSDKRGEGHGFDQYRERGISSSSVPAGHFNEHSRFDVSDEDSNIAAMRRAHGGRGGASNSATGSGFTQGPGRGQGQGRGRHGSFDNDFETDEDGVPHATDPSVTLHQRRHSTNSLSSTSSVHGVDASALSLGIAGLGSSRSPSISPRRCSSPTQGTPASREVLTPRGSSINDLIAKFSNPPTPTRSRGSSFIGEMISNVHSDIYPSPVHPSQSPFLTDLETDMGAGMSEEDDRHPRTSNGFKKTPFIGGAGRGREVIEVQAFEGCDLDADERDMMNMRRAGSQMYRGKKVPASSVLPSASSASTTAVTVARLTPTLSPMSTSKTDLDPIPAQRDSDYFEYSHIHHKSSSDSVRRDLSGSKLSGKGSADRLSNKERAEMDEEEAFRNKIFEATTHDAHSAFSETNPMMRKSVKSAAVPRVFTNPTKKVILKTSVVGNIRKNNAFIALPEKTDSADSIPDGNESSPDSPSTILDVGIPTSPWRRSADTSVCTQVDCKSPTPDIVISPGGVEFDMHSVSGYKNEVCSYENPMKSVAAKNARLSSAVPVDSADAVDVLKAGGDDGKVKPTSSSTSSPPSSSSEPNTVLENVTPVKYVTESSSLINDNDVSTVSKNRDSPTFSNSAAFSRPTPISEISALKSSNQKSVPNNESSDSAAAINQDITLKPSTDNMKLVPNLGSSEPDTNTVTVIPSLDMLRRGLDNAKVSSSHDSGVLDFHPLKTSQNNTAALNTNTLNVVPNQDMLRPTGDSAKPNPASDTTMTFGSLKPVPINDSPVSNSNTVKSVPNQDMLKSNTNTSNFDTVVPNSGSMRLIPNQNMLKPHANNVRTVPSSSISPLMGSLASPLSPASPSLMAGSDAGSVLTESIVEERMRALMRTTLESAAVALAVPDKKLFGHRIQYRQRPHSLDMRSNNIQHVPLGHSSTANSPRRLRHVDDVPRAGFADSNRFNLNELKLNLNRIDPKSFTMGSEESSRPVMSFAMTDFNSSDESGDEDESSESSLSMTPTMLVRTTSGSECSIIPRSHSVSLASTFNAYAADSYRPAQLGYSKSYSSSGDVQRKHQEMFASDKVVPHPGMYLSRNSSIPSFASMNDGPIDMNLNNRISGTWEPIDRPKVTETEGEKVRMSERDTIVGIAVPVPVKASTSEVKTTPTQNGKVSDGEHHKVHVPGSVADKLSAVITAQSVSTTAGPGTGVGIGVNNDKVTGQPSVPISETDQPLDSPKVSVINAPSPVAVSDVQGSSKLGGTHTQAHGISVPTSTADGVKRTTPPTLLSTATDANKGKTVEKEEKKFEVVQASKKEELAATVSEKSDAVKITDPIISNPNNGERKASLDRKEEKIAPHIDVTMGGRKVIIEDILMGPVAEINAKESAPITSSTSKDTHATTPNSIVKTNVSPVEKVKISEVEEGRTPSMQIISEVEDKVEKKTEKKVEGQQIHLDDHLEGSKADKRDENKVEGSATSMKPVATLTSGDPVDSDSDDDDDSIEMYHTVTAEKSQRVPQNQSVGADVIATLSTAKIGQGGNVAAVVDVDMEKEKEKDVLRDKRTSPSTLNINTSAVAVDNSDEVPDEVPAAKESVRSPSSIKSKAKSADKSAEIATERSRERAVKPLEPKKAAALKTFEKAAARMIEKALEQKNDEPYVARKPREERDKDRDRDREGGSICDSSLDTSTATLEGLDSEDRKGSSTEDTPLSIEIPPVSVQRDTFPFSAQRDSPIMSAQRDSPSMSTHSAQRETFPPPLIMSAPPLSVSTPLPPLAMSTPERSCSPNDIIPALTSGPGAGTPGVGLIGLSAPLSIRERLKLKQDLLKKQREDKERGDSNTPSPASSSPTHQASPLIADLEPDSTAVTELPIKSVEVQFEMDQLKFDVLNNLTTISAEEERELAHKNSAVKVTKEEEPVKVSQNMNKSFSDDSSSDEEEGDKKRPYQYQKKQETEVEVREEEKKKSNVYDAYEEEDDDEYAEREFSNRGASSMHVKEAASRSISRSSAASSAAPSTTATSMSGSGAARHVESDKRSPAAMKSINNNSSSSNNVYGYSERGSISSERHPKDMDDKSLGRSLDSIAFESLSHDMDMYEDGEGTRSRSSSRGSMMGFGSRDGGEGKGKDGKRKSFLGRIKKSFLKNVVGKISSYPDNKSTKSDVSKSDSRDCSVSGDKNGLDTSSMSREERRRHEIREEMSRPQESFGRPHSERSMSSTHSNSFYSQSNPNAISNVSPLGQSIQGPPVKYKKNVIVDDLEDSFDDDF